MVESENNDNSGRFLVDFSDLAKILPIGKIYDDLLSRGFAQIGNMFEDFVKSIRLALPRGQLDAVTQDKFRRIIEDPYFRVPAQYRTLPPSQLIGQTLEGVRFEPEDTVIWEMFEELLERGYDDRCVNVVHPAFVGIVKQLAPDEARLLKVLSKEILTVTYSYQKGDVSRSVGDLELKDCLRDLNLDSAEFVLVYLEHLHSLGLIGPLIGSSSGMVEQGAYAGFERFVFHCHISAFGRMLSAAVSPRT